MISPITPDEDWKATLCNLPQWTPPQARTLVISPHPDDETLGAGGLITTLRGKDVDVWVIAVTDGENAYEKTIGLGAVRRMEQEKALARLGVDSARIIRLGLPDRDVSEHEDELYERLLLLARCDCHIIAPWTGDFHPDHEGSGRAAKRVADKIGASITFYFFWTWHRGQPEDILGFSLKTLRLDNGAIRAKCEALQCHRSQLEHSSGDPILPANLLSPVSWPFEVFLAA